MPRKNSATKPICSFRLSSECVHHIKDIKDLYVNMELREVDVVEVSIDWIYREEFRFGNLMIGEG